MKASRGGEIRSALVEEGEEVRGGVQVDVEVDGGHGVGLESRV